MRPRGSIWTGSGTIFLRFVARMPREPRTPRTPAKTRPRAQVRQEWVGGGAPPPGGFQSAAHRRWCEACWIHCHIAKKLSALISHKGPIRKAKLLMMGQALDPLSFSLPRRGGMTGNRRQKVSSSALGGLSGRFLTPPERASKMTSKKHRKNRENRGFWCPKTLPKPSPKPFQIDIPKNT